LRCTITILCRRLAGMEVGHLRIRRPRMTKQQQAKPFQLSSPLRRLKRRPKEIAGELVNLTPERAGAFLQTHRWRLLFPASETKPRLPDNTREPDPETGEPIPGTRPTLKTWKQPEPMKAKEADTKPQRCNDCKKITRHVLVDVEDKEVPDKFYHLYICESCRNTRMQNARNASAEISKRDEEVTLLKWAALLAGMWTQSKGPQVYEAMEQIFAAERPAVWNENLQRWSGTLPLERPAIRITRSGFPFERRDLLDTLAWTILEASKCGFLRQCKSGCATPLFVATSATQDYCSKCSVNREKQRNAEWAKKDRARKAVNVRRDRGTPSAALD
jgi:hypothetical protein